MAAYVKENLGIDIDVNSIFDCQAKRLHAYKRQLLNIFHVMYLYLRMKQILHLEFTLVHSSILQKQQQVMI